MKKILLITILILSNNISGKEIFSVIEKKPYVFLNNNKVLTGPYLENVKCAAKNIFIDVHYRVEPNLRAIKNIKNGYVSATFPISNDNSEFNPEKLSAPLSIEKWIFVHFKDKDINNIFKKKIGVLKGSSQERYLMNKGVTPYIKFKTNEHLVKSLKSHQIDVAFFELKNFNLLSSSLDNFEVKFFKYSETNVLFNKNIENRKIFNFSKKLENCNRPSFKLSEFEKEILNKKTLNLYNKLLVNEKLKKKLENIEVIKSKSKDWNKKLYNEVMQNKLSVSLKNFAKKNKNEVNEIFIHSRNGNIVGMNEKTSDFYQGDEQKSIKIFKQKKDLYMSDLTYDLSTKKFQVQVTYPIKIKNEVAFAITFGLNVSTILEYQE